VRDVDCYTHAVTVTAADDDIPASEILDNIFTRDTTGHPIITIHGYGIHVKVQQGHLVIKDGIGKHQRERRYPQADRTLRRIVITGPDGYITLDALRYCRDHNIAVTTLDPDGELTSHYAPSTAKQDVRLIRRQCLAGMGQDTVTGIEITSSLLTCKINGQADNIIKLFSDMNTSARLYHYAEQIQSAETLAELNDLERFAAKAYFQTWVGRVAIPWDAKTIARIPVNWLTYDRRKISATNANTHRHATDPVNAMLNYGYGIGYTLSKSACIAHSLNPALGFNHGDRNGRDSLALDILETMRPHIDAYILSLTGIGSKPYPFTYRSFTEPYGLPPGTVRITAPLTHVIIEASYAWESTAMNAAETVVSHLTGANGRRGGKSLSLTNQKSAFISNPVDVEAILPDTDWQRFLQLLPSKSDQDYSSISNRTVLAALIYLRANHKSAAYVPTGFGVSRRTLHERRLRWTRLGYWPEIERTIDDCAVKLSVRQ
jgi:CRISP-associated protein Cas1